MNRKSKAMFALSGVCFAGGVFGAHSAGSLYPMLPLGTVLAVMLCAIGVIYAEGAQLAFISCIVTLGVGYRLAVFLIPQTLLNFDPDAHAVRSEIIRQTGHTGALEGVFYGTLPGFNVAGALVGIITGISTADAYVYFPLVTALVSPLYGLVFYRHITAPEAETVGGLAAAVILPAVGASSIKYSSAPIPLLFSSLIIPALLILLLQYRNGNSAFVLWPVLIFGISLGLIAKISLLLVFGIINGVLVFDYAFAPRNRDPERGVGLIAGLFGLAVAIQWIFATEFLVSAAGVFGVLQRATLDLSQPSRAAAVQYAPQLSKRVLHLIYLITGLGFAGLAGTYALFKRTETHPMRLVLATSLVVALLAIGGILIPFFPGFNRLLFYGTPFFAALIGYGVDTLAASRRIQRFLSPQSVATFILLLIVVTNLFSALATPDYGDGPRMYLTAQEVEAKEFAHTKIQEQVYLDTYYGDEVVNIPRAAQGPVYHQRTVPHPEYRPGIFGRALTNGTLISEGYEYIGLRRDVEVYRLDDGRWRLTWNPEQRLDQAYSRIYASDDVAIYSSSTS